MPAPINITPPPPPPPPGNETLNATLATANATANTTTGVVTTSAPAPVDVAGAIGQLFAGGGSPAVTIIGAVFIIVVLLITPYAAYKLVKLFFGPRPPAHRMPFIYYDYETHSLVFEVLYRLDPGIYVSRDGKTIALVRKDSKPVELRIPLSRDYSKYRRGFYGHRIGGTVFDIEPVEEIALELASTHGLGGGETAGITGIADLLLSLYNKGLVPKTMPINPAMKLVLTVDSDRVGETLSLAFAKYAEEGLVGVSAITGRRKEHEEHVRRMLETELKRLEAVTSTVARVFIIVGIVVVIILGAAWIMGILG